jgi:hypothetical protein
MGYQMRSTFRCLLACALCILMPTIGHAGPLGDALRDVSARQAATAPGKSRQGVWVGGIVLTVVGGVLIIGGQTRTHDEPRPPGCESIGIFGCTGSVRDPNNSALIGAGAAAVGAGIIMILLGRNKAVPQIITSPGRLATQYTLKF